MSAEPIDIALWGAAQAGKTTALACWICHDPPTWIDPNDPASRDARRHLDHAWSSLHANQLPPPTTRARHHLLCHRDGRRVRFRDMAGGFAERPGAGVEDPDALAAASAAMFFLEWPDRRTLPAVRAVERGLAEVGDRPRVLVVTKCEGPISESEFWRFVDDPRTAPGLPLELRRVIARFDEGRVFPVSVFGWYEGRPAAVLDEFGRMVPWNIQPKAVAEPFLQVLHDLHLP